MPLVLMLFLVLIFLPIVVVVYWLVRPHVQLETELHQSNIRLIISDGKHNGFTSLINWQGKFYLAYTSSPAHFYHPKSRLIVKCSVDRITWDTVLSLKGSDCEYRDPKLAVIHNRLFVFALQNRSFDPQPHGTVQVNSMDGENWTEVTEISQIGWLFGQPKTFDYRNWYVSAHCKDFDKVAVFRSEDGVYWEKVSNLVKKTGLDETALEFMPDGSLMVVIRFEIGSSILGDVQNGTLIMKSSYPFEEWVIKGDDKNIRLDSPSLLLIDSRMIAVGRYQPPGIGVNFYQGSIFSRKRTTIFVLTEGRFERLCDLPSNGDTGYAGCLLENERLIVSYYSNELEKDFPWVIGMLKKTNIYLAELDKERLERGKLQ